jgi:hypothetical protein
MRHLATTAFVFAALAGQTFDHTYAKYGELLARHVDGARVDYRRLVADRATLEAAAAGFAQVSAETERAWSHHERLAFWINAYNLFTLDAIARHYPIKARFFTMQPRNSIRQIDGVWTSLTWKAAGRDITLDGIEHGIVRKEFHEPLIHFALNCASVSCPPLRAEPYVASKLDEQLADSARRYLSSPEGARVDDETIRVSSIFKWYGEDFLARYSADEPRDRAPVERAILEVLRRYGPADVARRAAASNVRLSFLPYNWNLNDVERSSS